MSDVAPNDTDPATAVAPDCVRYLPGWVPEPARLFDELIDQISWEQRDITLFGRTMPTPRLTCWMGPHAYTYSHVRNEPRPMVAPIRRLAADLQRETGAVLDSCLANLYRDGRDSNGFHADDEPELGPEPTIVSVSLGARRRFVLRHQASRQRWVWELGHGDVLIMSGQSQRDYRHAIPKTARPVGPRMNLTFRHFFIDPAAVLFP